MFQTNVAMLICLYCMRQFTDDFSRANSYALQGLQTSSVETMSESDSEKLAGKRRHRQPQRYENDQTPAKIKCIVQQRDGVQAKTDRVNEQDVEDTTDTDDEQTSAEAELPSLSDSQHDRQIQPNDDRTQQSALGQRSPSIDDAQSHTDGDVLEATPVDSRHKPSSTCSSESAGRRFPCRLTLMQNDADVAAQGKSVEQVNGNSKCLYSILHDSLRGSQFARVSMTSSRRADLKLQQ